MRRTISYGMLHCGSSFVTSFVVVYFLVIMKWDFISLRSCDRCHAIKQRCQRTPGSTRCDRCCRLSLSCDFKRRVKGIGRPSRPYHHLRHPVSSESPTQNAAPAVTENISTIINNFSSNKCMNLQRVLADLGDPTASPNGLAMMEAVLADPRFTGMFVLGPSMGSALSTTLVSQLRKSRKLLHNAYLACVASMPDTNDDGIVAPLDEVDNKRLDFCYRRASSALACFRSCAIQDARHISSCLVLAGALLTFGLRVDEDMGNKGLVICSEALCLVKPFYERGASTHPR